MSRAAPFLLGLVLAGASAAGAAQEPGKLFFTPEQREALDARRKARIPDKPAAAAQSPATRIDGKVTRSGGNSTVWINGQPVPEGDEADGLRLHPGRSDPSRVTVSGDKEKQRIRLRVGETWDRGSGEVQDVIGGGEVRIHRRGSAAR
jgi:hypothetical protein